MNNLNKRYLCDTLNKISINRNVETERKVSIQELIDLNEDMCVVIPRSTFYFWV